MPEQEEALELNNDLARAVTRKLQARMRGRLNYRKRRDRKIAVDYIGREFEMGHTRELGQTRYYVRVRLVSYNPDTCMVVFRYHNGDTIPADTDSFWRMRRDGDLRDC